MIALSELHVIVGDCWLRDLEGVDDWIPTEDER